MANETATQDGGDPWLAYGEAARAAGVSEKTWDLWRKSDAVPPGVVRRVAVGKGSREQRFWRRSEAVALRRPKVGDEGWLTLDEAAAAVGINAKTWRRWEQGGAIASGVMGEGRPRKNGARGTRTKLWRREDVEAAARKHAAFQSGTWPPEGCLLADGAAAYLGMTRSHQVRLTAEGRIAYRGELRRGPNGPDCRLYQITELDRVKRELADAAAERDRIPDGYVDFAGAAAFFGVVPGTLNAWQQQGKVRRGEPRVRSDGSRIHIFDVAYLEEVRQHLEAEANRPTAPEGYVELHEAAERLSIAPATVTKWEHGGRLPRATVVPIPGTGTRTKVYPEAALTALLAELRAEAETWPPPGWLTVDEAADRAGVSSQTWRVWGQDGRYTFGEWRQKPTLVGLGRCKLYRAEDVDRFVATLPDDHWLFVEFDEKRLRWGPPTGYVFGEEAAAMFGVTPGTLSHWANDGEIDCVRLARVPPGEAGVGEGALRRVYPIDEVQRLVEERERNGRTYVDPHDPLIARVPIMRYRQTRFEAIIDVGDLPAVQAYRWNFLPRYVDGRATSEGHVAKSGLSGDQIPMARMLLNLSTEERLAYRDGDPLNCRRSNLVVRDYGEVVHGNGKRSVGFAGTEPTSRYKGVCWSERDGKWIAQIHRAGIRYGLGSFDDELAAAEAYDEAARAVYDEQARRNFFTRDDATWVERRVA